MKRLAAQLTQLMTVLALTSGELLACPMCKLAAESTDRQPQAYMVSILFMLGMIGSVAGGVGGLLFWAHRLETKALRAAGYEHVLHNGVTRD